MSISPRSLAILLAATVVAAHACGGSGPEIEPADLPAATPTPTPINAQALLEQAGRAMESVSSFEFRLDHESGGTVLMPNLVIRELEGRVVRPDRISVEFKGRFGNFAIKGSLVSVGDTSFMTNPLTDAWEKVPPDVSPVGFFNEIAVMMSRVTQASAAPEGDGLFSIRGRLPAEALEPLVGTTVTGATMAVELVVRGSDFYLVRVTFDGKVTEDEDADTVRRISLSKFNEPFIIEPPE